MNDPRGISRRELMRRGGTLALAAGALPLLPTLAGCSHDESPPGEGSRRDADAMRKCISLGGPGPLREEGHPDDYRLWGNREYFAESETAWAKLWVSWMDLQQELGSAPKSIERSWEHLNGAPGGQAWLRRLDRQVRAANDDGIGVIVTLFHAFPTWSSGARANDEVSPRKPPEWRLPRDLSPDGPWGWFIAHLCARYRRGAERNEQGPRRPGDAGNPDGAWIDSLEITNEPNLLFWPQEAIERPVARMIRSAASVSRREGGVAILAPGTSDFPDQDHENDRGLIATNWKSFTRAVLAELRGFRPDVPVYWSQHNFQDVKHRKSPSRAEQVLELLEGQAWLAARRPLWLTEGGYDLFPRQRNPKVRRKQARLIEASYRRMAGTNRVAVWTQHTINDKAGNDFKSGLRDDFIPGKGPGARRPAWHTWKRLRGPDQP